MPRRLAAVLLFCLISAAPAARAAQESCECEAERPATLAVVNGIGIPTSQIEADTAEIVEPIKQQMGAVREQALQTLITNRLVELEAAKRGVSSPRLIQDEVVAKAGEPTTEELRAFYDRNPQAMGGKSFEEVEENLRVYVRTQRQSAQMTILTTDLRTSADIQVLEYSPKPPASELDRAKVLATVNGSKVTSGDLEDSIRSYLYQFRHQIWEVESEALENRIADVLVDQEAKHRNTTVEALTAAEIAPKAKKVDAFDASKFYNEHKDQFGGRPFAEIRDDLVKLLESHELYNAKRAFAGTLRKTATVKVNLVEPASPSYAIETAGRPALGAPAAPVTIIVFSDFQCPKCAAAHTTLDAIAKEFAGKVRVVSRNYPLEQHPWAYRAAQAAEAAFEQGKYWEYADLLFANQKDLSPEKLKQLATQAGLDRAKFDAALDSGKFAAVVDRDLVEGNRVGVQGTPAVYVNGRPVGDDSPAGLRAAVEAALKGGA
jgi:protein-disulfide isomerase